MKRYEDQSLKQVFELRNVKKMTYEQNTTMTRSERKFMKLHIINY